MRKTIAFMSVLILAGCAITPIVKTDVHSHLRATLKPDGQSFKTNGDVKLRCIFQNTSSSALELDTFPLGSATSSVDVFDSSGKRIPSVPPPMPPPPNEAPRYLKVIRPGRSIKEKYSLYMFSPPLTPGTYTARMRHVDSNEITFTITEPMRD